MASSFANDDRPDWGTPAAWLSDGSGFAEPYWPQPGSVAPLDLTPYPTADELEPAPADDWLADAARAAEPSLTLGILVSAFALIGWMIFGLVCAHIAGRL